MSDFNFDDLQIEQSDELTMLMNSRGCAELLYQHILEKITPKDGQPLWLRRFNAILNDIETSEKQGYTIKIESKTDNMDQLLLISELIKEYTVLISGLPKEAISCSNIRYIPIRLAAVLNEAVEHLWNVLKYVYLEPRFQFTSNYPYNSCLVILPNFTESEFLCQVIYEIAGRLKKEYPNDNEFFAVTHMIPVMCNLSCQQYNGDIDGMIEPLSIYIERVMSAAYYEEPVREFGGEYGVPRYKVQLKPVLRFNI